MLHLNTYFYYDMRKILITLIILSSDCYSQTISNHEIDMFRGMWVVEKILPGNITFIDQHQASLFLNKQMLISDSTYLFSDILFHNPTFTFKRMWVNDLFPIYRSNSQEVGILSDSVTMVDVLDSNSPGRDSFILENNRLIAFREGWFIYFRKE